VFIQNATEVKLQQIAFFLIQSISPSLR